MALDYINIRSLTLEELVGLVNLYPWYSAARLELCRRMAEAGALSDSQVAETALQQRCRNRASGG